MINKQQLCVNLAAKSYSIYRIARVLSISERQVVRYVLTAGDERTKRPRKPTPTRIYYFDIDTNVDFLQGG